MSDNGAFVCYLLKSQLDGIDKSYIGVTNNFTRRIRQHNGEIQGGAKKTKRFRPWSPVLFLSGFRSYVEALQFEWAWQHMRPRSLKLESTLKRLEILLQKEKWTSNSPLASEVSLKLQWMNSSPELLKFLNTSEIHSPIISREFLQVSI